MINDRRHSTISMTTFRRSPVLLQLAFTHFGNNLHEWLPCPFGMTGNLDAFGSTLIKAGIQKVGFLRHGKTAPAENGGDFERQLTDIGREQAREAGSSFGNISRPFFPTVLVSIAPRTMETAQLFCEASHETTTVQDYYNPRVLYDGTMQPDGSKLFRKLGYAPLKDYLDAADDEDRQVAQTVLGAYAHNVANVMMEAVQNTSQTFRNGTTLWMVGHAIYLPAAALGVASILECNDDGKDLILSTNTAEAEGYLIDVSKKSVSSLIRPSNKGWRRYWNALRMGKI
jgi:Histidine phosphatase superfamily (branch 1)